MRRSWTPSIVPNCADQTFCLVLDDFGQTVISDMMSGQFNDPVSLVAFNTTERWSEDVSEDIAREIMRRLSLAGDELPLTLEEFVDRHLGTDRQLTLRLA